MMDLRYSRALRDATYTWSQKRVVDNVTLENLRRGAQQTPQKSPEQPDQARRVAMSPSAAEAAVVQTQLAQYGNLGTRLNVYA